MNRNALLASVLFAILLAGCQPETRPAAPLAIETGISPEAWVVIPAGEFLMGQHDHATQLPYDYEMMVTDVTNAQYAQFLNDALAGGKIELQGANPLGYYPGDQFHGYKHEQEIPAGMVLLVGLDGLGIRIETQGGVYQPKAGYANHPVTSVTWFGARAYCEYYGWRLPGEVEWEKAARGFDDNRPYPWGDEIERNNANYYSSHDIFEKLAGKSDTTPVGFYNGQTYLGYLTLDSASPYGLYDMAGNVWQWTGDIYPNQHYRYLRGGIQESYAYNLRVWTRNSAAPEYFSPNVGFRCARGP